MNDLEIRSSFHRKKLRKYHLSDDTLIVDELGLNHGKYRVDIAVVNGSLNGFEIKSDRDHLGRLDRQIEAYNLIFDHLTLVVGPKHFEEAIGRLPDWWGVVYCQKGPRGAMHFKSIRRAKVNNSVDPKSLIQLLWRPEAEDILRQSGESAKLLRSPRRVLYDCLVEKFDAGKVKLIVRQCLKKRKNWRDQPVVSQYDGSCQPISM